jgi:hypothetical protein
MPEPEAAPRSALECEAVDAYGSARWTGHQPVHLPPHTALVLNESKFDPRKVVRWSQDDTQHHAGGLPHTTEWVSESQADAMCAAERRHANYCRHTRRKRAKERQRQEVMA